MASAWEFNQAVLALPASDPESPHSGRVLSEDNLEVTPSTPLLPASKSKLIKYCSGLWKTPSFAPHSLGVLG